MSDYTMRSPCRDCGSTLGRIERRGAQDCVFCVCDRFQYNAPKTETGRAPRTTATTHNGIKPKQRARILTRANSACELCHASNKILHVGHIVSVEDGLELGLTDVQINSDENVMALCDECNLGMGSETVPLWLAASIIKARSGGAA